MRFSPRLSYLRLRLARTGRRHLGAAGYVVRIESGSVILTWAKGWCPNGPAFHHLYGRRRTQVPQTRTLAILKPFVAEGALASCCPVLSRLHSSGAARSSRHARKVVRVTLPPAAVAPPTATDKDGAVSSYRPVKGPIAVTGMSIADFRGEGKQTLAISDKRPSASRVSHADTQPLSQLSCKCRPAMFLRPPTSPYGKAELFATFTMRRSRAWRPPCLSGVTANGATRCPL